jgi:signal transduction histidine kinase
VVVTLDNDETRLRVEVVDDGRGLDPAFELDSATGLGLSIVRTLVTTELNGEIKMRPARAADLAAAGLGPEGGADHGTVVELVVPLEHA